MLITIRIKLFQRNIVKIKYKDAIQLVSLCARAFSYYVMLGGCVAAASLLTTHTEWYH